MVKKANSKTLYCLIEDWEILENIAEMEDRSKVRILSKAINEYANKHHPKMLNGE